MDASTPSAAPATGSSGPVSSDASSSAAPVSSNGVAEASPWVNEALANIPPASEAPETDVFGDAFGGAFEPETTTTEASDAETSAEVPATDSATPAAAPTYTPQQQPWVDFALANGMPAAVAKLGWDAIYPFARQAKELHDLRQPRQPQQPATPPAGSQNAAAPAEEVKPFEWTEPESIDPRLLDYTKSVEARFAKLQETLDAKLGRLDPLEQHVQTVVQHHQQQALNARINTFNSEVDKLAAPELFGDPKSLTRENHQVRAQMLHAAEALVQAGMYPDAQAAVPHVYRLLHGEGAAKKEVAKVAEAAKARKGQALTKPNARSAPVVKAPETPAERDMAAIADLAVVMRKHGWTGEVDPVQAEIVANRRFNDQ